MEELLKKLDIANLSTSSLLLIKMGSQFVPHEQTNNWLQGRAIIPKNLHDKIAKNFDEPTKQKAERLRQQLAEVQANYTLFMASQGGIEPDYAEFADLVLDDDGEPALPAAKKGKKAGDSASTESTS